MGLFGDTDVADIPDNPFYVAPGTYPCVLAEISIQSTKDQSGQGLTLKWVIEDEDSEYHHQNLQEWFNIYPDVAQDEVTTNMKKDLSRLKMRLTSLGVPLEEMDSFNEDKDEYIGTHAFVTCIERPDKNDPDTKYTNVTKVSLDAE
jgi:hypothetical protein